MPALDQVLTLRAELANDALSLGKVLEKLKVRPENLRALPPSDPVVAAAAFEVHNYYSVSENLMRRVATAFENALDPSAWHRQLLYRMALDIEGIRPALIDRSLKMDLDELRNFRHFFRNAYDRQLDPGKVADNLALLLSAHGTWLDAIQRFQNWLDGLAQGLRAPPSSPR